MSETSTPAPADLVGIVARAAEPELWKQLDDPAWFMPAHPQDQALKAASLARAERSITAMQATPAAQPSWRCFHCGEIFTRESCARAHFGADETYEPACQIAARDGGLVRALREAEASALEAHQQAHDESGDALKAWRAAVGRYEQRIIDAEQAGYDKGVADMRKELSDARPVSVDDLRSAMDAITHDALPLAGATFTAQSRAKAQVEIAEAVISLTRAEAVG